MNHTPEPWRNNVPAGKFPIYADHPANRFCYVAVTPQDDGISSEERNANAARIVACVNALAGGCGMDMGFHVVYNLAHVLFGDGYALKHSWL